MGGGLADKGLRRTVELRVHGVGYQTPEHVLGVERPEDAVDLTPRSTSPYLVQRADGTSPPGASAEDAAHAAERGQWDPDVQAMLWNNLATSARSQGFWPILLPFTLVNMAGWMHPAATTGYRRFGARVISFATIVLGFTLTISWGLWLAIIVRTAQETYPTLLRDLPWVLIGCGAAIVLVIVAFVALVARGVFGSELPGDGDGLKSGSLKAYWWVLAAALALVVLPFVNQRIRGYTFVQIAIGLAGLLMCGVIAWVASSTRKDFEDRSSPASETAVEFTSSRSAPKDLTDPFFFDRERRAGAKLLGTHVVLLLGAFVGGFLAYKTSAPRFWDLIDMSWTDLAFVANGVVQGLALLALYILSFEGCSSARFRVCGSATMAGVAILISNSVFAGFAFWLHKRSGTGAFGPEFVLLDVVVFGAVLFLFLAAGWVAYAVVPAKMDVKVRMERLARIPRQLDVPLSCAVGLTWLLSAAAFCLRIRKDDWTFDSVAPLVTVGVWALPLAAIAVFTLVRQSVQDVEKRRQLGMVWDVISFWPRRFHPFAVRPYAERAVPFLQDHLLHITRQGVPVVVSAHSQGSVLTYAAIKNLSKADGPNGTSLLDAKKVALVTYGSPLLRLYSRYFPHCFKREDFRKLVPDDPTVHSWLNYFHETDPIGQEVFTAPDELPGVPDMDTKEGGVEIPLDRRADVQLDDPPATEVPDPADPPGDRPLATGPVGSPTRDDLAVHSRYRQEPVVKKTIRRLRTELAPLSADPAHFTSSGLADVRRIEPNWEMTQWFGPRLLAELAWKTAKPKGRVTFPPPDVTKPELRSTGGKLTVDFVADVGDGIDPTLSVAAQIAAPSLVVGSPEGGSSVTLDGASILVMGGDEVYPRPKARMYWNQTFGPYAMAANMHDPEPTKGEPTRQVFALPGNHDWYDGLEEFRNWFCSDASIAGHSKFGWQSKQAESYFALHLREKWWLYAVDAGPRANHVDDEQLDYFLAIAKHLEPGHRVILCWGKPVWLDKDRDSAEAELMRFVDGVILKKAPDEVATATERSEAVPLYLTGDLHHYNRYAHASDKAAAEMRITAGGGGAFLHPTHALESSVEAVLNADRDDTASFGLAKKAVYPSETASKKLAKGLLWKFVPLNNRFWVMAAAIAGGVAWAWQPWVADPTVKTFGWRVGAAVTLVLLTLGFSFFEKKAGLGLRLLAIGHGIVQFVGVLAAMYAAAHWISWRYAVALTVGVWALAGSFVMGAYLTIANVAMKAHGNEAFSALRIADYKGFVRMVFDGDSLTVYPIKVQQTGHWKGAVDGLANPFPAVAPSAPELIEDPLCFENGKWSSVPVPKAPSGKDFAQTVEQLSVLVEKSGQSLWSVIGEAVESLSRRRLGDPSVAPTDGRFRKEWSERPAEVTLRQTSPVDFVVEEPVRYLHPIAGEIEVPEGYLTDLASVPPLLTWMVPRYGRHTLAALLHDRLQHEPPNELAGDGVDQVFRDAMGDCGVPLVRRWMMFAAVNLATAARGSWLSKVFVGLWELLAAGGYVAAYALVCRLGSYTFVSAIALALQFLAPVVLCGLWGKRWKTALIASIGTTLVVIPVLGVGVAIGVYASIEWCAGLFQKNRSPMFMRRRVPSPPPKKADPA